MIQIFSNTIGFRELMSIKECFDSRWVGAGEKVAQFEAEFGKKVGKKVLATNSCTSAMMIALRALGIGKGDEVIIPTINFIGCANLVAMLGATPVFCDVDPRYFNINIYDCVSKITRRTKAIIPLHYGGHPCDIEGIWGYGLQIIEDSANSVSSRYSGVHCGTLGVAGCWSFDSMKTLVTGDGGMLYIHPEYYDRAIAYRYLGLEQRSGIDSQKSGNKRWWEVNVGYPSDRNIMNDITASIGLEQLKKLPTFIERRKEIWRVYQSEFADLSWLELPPEPLQYTESSYYLYWLKLKDRDEFAQYMVDNVIYVTFRYYPLHMVPYYESKTRLPVAEEISEQAINIPIHQNLNNEDLDFIIDRVRNWRRKNVRNQKEDTVYQRVAV